MKIIIDLEKEAKRVKRLYRKVKQRYEDYQYRQRREQEYEKISQYYKNRGLTVDKERFIKFGHVITEANKPASSIPERSFHEPMSVVDQAKHIAAQLEGQHVEINTVTPYNVSERYYPNGM